MDEQINAENRTNVRGGGAVSSRTWIDDVLDHTIAAYKGRKIVLWGCYETSWTIQERLKSEHGVETAFFVDSDPAKQNSASVQPPACLAGRQNEYFVIIPLVFYPSVKNAMASYGYQKDLDYSYYENYQDSTAIVQREDYYEDARGNKIIGRRAGLHVIFLGVNATLRVGNGIALVAPVPDVTVTMSSHAVAEIGERCIFHNVRIFVRDHAVLQIGADTSFGEESYLACYSYSKVLIGRDCMFSRYVFLYSSDSHSMFDVETGENLNSTSEQYLQRSKIVLGDHVWIGVRATILYDTVVENGSIIGANSLVKGKFPNNCMVAGNPAKIIRRNVAWSRNNFAESILDCGEANVHMTQEDGK